MVTKQQQLEWMANHVCEWSKDFGKKLKVSKSEIGIRILWVYPACEFYEITREEWQQERDRQAELKAMTMQMCELKPLERGNMKKQQDNSWHDRGELPPVGCMVDVTGDDVAYGYGESECEVLAHVEDCAVIRMSFGLGCFVAKVLSPSRTKREKAIEEMVKAAGSRARKDEREICEALYDAGYRMA